MAPKIGFTVTECIEADPSQNLYRVRISIEMKDGNQPVDGAIIIKAPGGEEVTISTDPGKGTGTGELFFSSPAIAIILIGEARIGGNLLTARQSVTLKTKSSKPIPDRISVEAVGDEGTYRFIGGVLAKDNGPVPNLPIEIYNDDTGKKEWDGTTDQHGAFVSDEVKFITPACSFLIRGGPISTKLENLSGPTKWRKPPEPPEPKRHQICYGLIHTIRSAWSQAGRDKKRSCS